MLVGGYLAVRGLTLISLGGTWYYLFAGLALLLVCILLVLRLPLAARLYGGILAVTTLWALFEAGLDLIALSPRLLAWIVVGLWFLSPWHAAAMQKSYRGGLAPGGTWVIGAGGFAVLSLAIASMQSYDVIENTRTEASTPAETEDWRNYGNTTSGSRFSELTQINRSNVTDLKEVWRFRTGIPYEFKNTPLQIGDLVYVCTAGNIVIAIDARSGEERWRHNPHNTLAGSTARELEKGNYFTRTCRGVSYHEAQHSYNGPCPNRIITGTTDARLIALNAATGDVCTDFGESGEVNLRPGLGPHKPFDYMVTSPPLIAGDRIVVGGWVIDNQELGNVSGVVRAYSATTGAFQWAWDVGNPDYRGMPADGAYYTRSTPNVWSIMSYDPDLDLIFAPTGNSAPDYYGAKRRPYDEKYSSSVVALRGTTGEVAWSYQTVRHDIWDYDVPSQPTLIDLKVNGRKIPAVIAPTKRGEIFALDRRNGEPIYPAQTCPDGSEAFPGGECPTPQGAIEGDFVTQTQPFSGLPHFRPYRHEKDMWGLTPLDHLFCRIEFKKMRYDGHFTPPMRGGGGDLLGGPTWGGSFQYPGDRGAFNWPSVSVDPDNGWLVAQPLLAGNRVVMLSTAEIPEDREKLRQRHLPSVKPEQGNFDPDTPRFASMEPFVSKWKVPLLGIPLNTPCFEPPLSKLAVIDLNTNKLLWSRPIGRINIDTPLGLKLHLPFELGMPAFGGTTTTRSGLIFQLGTFDSLFRAIDIQTGKILWSTEIPATSKSTPITYSVDETQYVVIAAPDQSKDGKGGWVIAYALSQK